MDCIGFLILICNCITLHWSCKYCCVVRSFFASSRSLPPSMHRYGRYVTYYIIFLYTYVSRTPEKLIGSFAKWASCEERLNANRQSGANDFPDCGKDYAKQMPMPFATERTAVRGSTTVGTTSRSPELLVSCRSKSVSNIDRYLVKSLNNK